MMSTADLNLPLARCLFTHRRVLYGGKFFAPFGAELA